jgi:hypothetical protein
VGVHPRQWHTDPDHLPVWEDRQLGGCAGLALAVLLALAVGLLLGLAWVVALA